MTSDKSTQVPPIEQSYKSSPPPPYYDHDCEHGENHDPDNEPVDDDTDQDEDAIYLRRNNIWAHRSPLELLFGILFFSSVIFFLVCFCVTAAIITRSAIRGV